MKLRLFAAGALAVALSLTAAPALGMAEPTAERARLFGPNVDRPGGAGYRLWAARWNEWLQEIPVPRNPAVDPNSPRNCATRFGAVLMGVNGTGDGCVVPKGRPIVFAYAGYECSTAEGNGRTFRQLRRCARQNYRQHFGDVQFRLRIDGVRVERPRRWTFTSRNRFVDFPRNNIWNAPAGPTRSVSKGIFHVLKPPPVGHHVIRAGFPRFANGVTFKFTVRKRS